MMAVSYLDGLARDRDMPLVICLALGSNMGNRGKDGPLRNVSRHCRNEKKKMCRGSSRKSWRMQDTISGKAHG